MSPPSSLHKGLSWNISLRRKAWAFFRVESIGLSVWLGLWIILPKEEPLANGLGASVLLDDTENFVGEKSWTIELELVKSDLESVCPETVSCADILAVVANDSVLLEVQMGRKDSLSASKAAATGNIRAPNSSVSNFQNAGIIQNDMVALSGAHTIGKARCSTFSSRFLCPGNYGGRDVYVDFVQSLQQPRS
ncbi:hypothetical protein H0E87_019274 [Populus deltoides]|uniref:peroxidase n=1 Tax=Populus deltoides TaxID=3696 RepID=A0A8T2XUG4_POPDE|nr:hypothetical protein H0E87_019274 [Populus deltoides]